MTVGDAAGFADAITAGVGQELLIATRFATADDLMWAGMRTAGGTPEFVAGHLPAGFLIDTYTPDDIAVTGSVDEKTGVITVDVPLDKLTTTVPQPETITTDPKQVRAIGPDTTLYGVMGLSFVGVNAIDDDLTKHVMDLTPAFTYGKVTAVKPARIVRGGAKAPRKPAPKPVLPATGVASLPQAWGLIAAAGALAVWTRRRVRA
jgi:hypothetical protein